MVTLSLFINVVDTRQKSATFRRANAAPYVSCASLLGGAIHLRAKEIVEINLAALREVRFWHLALIRA